MCEMGERLRRPMVYPNPFLRAARGHGEMTDGVVQPNGGANDDESLQLPSNS